MLVKLVSKEEMRFFLQLLGIVINRQLGDPGSGSKSSRIVTQTHMYLILKVKNLLVGRCTTRCSSSGVIFFIKVFQSHRLED